MPRKKIVNTKSFNLYQDPAVWMIGVSYVAGMIILFVVLAMTSGSSAVPPQANQAAAGQGLGQGSPFSSGYGNSQFGYGDGVAVSDVDNLIRNGDFELPVTRTESSVVVASNPQFGWDVEWTTRGDRLDGDNRQPGVEVLSGYRDWRAAVGAQFVRLDVADLNARSERTRSLVTVSQEVKTQNRDYTLSFSFAPQPGTDEGENYLTVRWNGQVVDEFSVDGENNSDPEWSVYSYTVNGTGGMDRLEFIGEGSENGEGNLLDNVVLIAEE